MSEAVEDLLIITVGLGLMAAFSYFNAWMGYHLKETRTESELLSMMSTEGRTGESRTGANQIAAQILYPHRFKVMGHICSTLAAIVLIYVLTKWSV